MKSLVDIVPSDWITVKLKTFSKTYSGGTPLRSNDSFYGGKIKWVKSSELKHKYLYKTEETITDLALQKTSARLVNTEAILFAMYGATAGDICILKCKASLNQAVLAIPVDDKKIDLEYLYYCLKQKAEKLKFITQGGGQPNLSKGIIDSLPISFPESKPEQTAIANILSRVDAAIEATQNSIKAAEKLKKALMQNLLTGKLKPDGTWRKEEEFYEDEKFGRVPKGWNFGALADIADVIAGQSPSGDTYNDEGKGVPMLNGPTEFTDYYPIPVQYTTKPTRMCEEGDILFTVRGSSTGRMNFADQDYCIGRGIAAIRANEDSDNDFLYYTLVTIAHKILAEAKGAGSTFPNVNRGELRKKKIIFPKNKDEQRRIGEKIRSIENLLQSKQTKILTLQRLKKSLMQQLLTGKVRLPQEVIERLGKEEKEVPNA